MLDDIDFTENYWNIFLPFTGMNFGWKVMHIHYFSSLYIVTPPSIYFTHCNSSYSKVFKFSLNLIPLINILFFFFPVYHHPILPSMSSFFSVLYIASSKPSSLLCLAVDYGLHLSLWETIVVQKKALVLIGQRFFDQIAMAVGKAFNLYVSVYVLKYARLITHLPSYNIYMKF
jgi:hypothetical protein